MSRTITLSAAFVLAALGAGCLSTPEGTGGPGGSDGGVGPGLDGAALQCEVGRSYVGIGGELLEARRVSGEAGADRLRLKPFGALAGEYARALGNTAATPRAFRATFGEAPARWFAEPEASANTLYAAYSLAYEGCLEYTRTAAPFAEAPTAATAASACTSMAISFWDREPTADEIEPCVALALEDTAAAPDTRTRWAHVCAAVLTAPGFLAY